MGIPKKKGEGEGDNREAHTIRDQNVVILVDPKRDIRLRGIRTTLCSDRRDETRQEETKREQKGEFGEENNGAQLNFWEQSIIINQ